MKSNLTYQVVIIGAGPYGLAAAARLRAANIETCVFGEAMEFWEKQMPAGMNLRSPRCASHIGDPQSALSLERYEAAGGMAVGQPIALEAFIDYGRWVQRQAVSDLDPRRVTRIETAPQGFRLVLSDGETVTAQRVVIAAGIGRFARRATQFDELPLALASHTAGHRDLGRFAGQRVAVVGGGQSALESAALLSESGAEVEVILRAPQVRWLGQRAPWLKSPKNPLRPLLYPPTDVGPPGLNMLVATPDLFRHLPRPLKDRIAYRCIRPAGASWLVSRVGKVKLTSGRTVRSATASGAGLKLKLDDGTERGADHALLATGYRIDVSKYEFLGAELVGRLGLVDGYPPLTAGMESAVPGLHFLGAPAAYSFGPLCRFVSGSAYAAHALTRRVVEKARTNGANHG